MVDFIRFPILEDGKASLTRLEKALVGLFSVLVHPRQVLELGVCRGATTKFLCDFFGLNDIDAHVVGFDLPGVVDGLRKSDKRLRELEASERLQLVGGFLPRSLREWLRHHDELIDLALVDATHDYPSVTAELSLLWPRLAPAGYILCHDYSSKYDGVRYAVDRFAKKHRATVLPLMSGPQSAQVGNSSVLVALGRPAHRSTFRGLFPHLVQKAKVDLLANRLFSRLWFNWIKPVCRRAPREA